MSRSASLFARPGLWTAAVFALIATAKIAALFALGPAASSDSASYLVYAEHLRAGSDWFHGNFDMDTARPPTTLRIIGYPALLAAARALAGERFDLLVITLQSIVSLIATFLVYRVGRALTQLRLWGLVAAVLYARTIVFHYDLHILTDSLFGHLYTIAVAIVALATLRGRTLSRRAVLGLGVLVALTVLLREVGALWSGFLVVLLVLLARTTARTWAQTATLVLLLVLPSLLVFSSYMAWNRYRTGRAFVTAGNATALMVPMFEVPAERFEEDTVLDRVARAHMQERTFEEVLEIVDALYRQHGLSAIEMAPVVRNRYMRSLAQHPFAYFVHALRSFVWFAPQMLFETPSAVYLLAGRQGQNFRARLLALQRSAGFNDWLQLALEVFFAAVSMFLFVLFLFGPPIVCVRALRRREPARVEEMLLGALWLTYMGATWMYCLVHFETRYITGVLACALLIAVRMLQMLDIPARLRRLASARNKKSEPHASG